MGRPRFSIASLLVVIGVFGMALAAFRNPSYLWANVTFTVAFAAIVMAIINTIYGQSGDRAYWLGFALCGGIYFAICTIPGIRDSLCPQLVTEVIFDFLYPHVSPSPPPAPPAQPGMMVPQAQFVALQGRIMALPPQAPVSRWSAWTEPDRTNGLGYPIGTVNLVSSEAFGQIGHALATLLVAVLGGIYARGRFEGATREMLPDLDREALTPTRLP
jgi:hypothetical protein